jgi:hypothetical protein
MISVLFFNSVQAASITNLDDKARSFEVKTGDGFETIQLQPGETWRTTFSAIVRMNEQESNIAPNQEFALWKGGAFGPQRVTPFKY